MLQRNRLLFSCTLVAALFLSSCSGGGKSPIGGRAKQVFANWEIENNTRTNIILTGYKDDVYVYKLDIPKGTRVVLWYYNSLYTPKALPLFSSLYDRSGETEHNHNLIKVTDSEGAVLKEWRLSDKDGAEKSYFKEDSWRQYIDLGDGSEDDDPEVGWYMVINPEDLQLAR